MKQLWTDHERDLFTATLDVLKDEKVFEKTTQPFPDPNLSIAFFMWKLAREDFMEVLEIIADREDDVAKLVHSFRLATNADLKVVDYKASA